MTAVRDAHDPAGTAYRTGGDGPPLLLAHGVGMTRDMWERQADHLRARFTVVTYDLIGHGESPKPAGPYDFGMFVRQIETLADHLGHRRFGLAGFSFGGMIARAAAIALPGRVQALTVMNSPHDRTPEERAAIRQRLAQARAAGPSANVDAALERWFTPEHAARCPEDVAAVRAWVLANDPDGYAAAYTLLAEGDPELRDAIRRIACPTLLVSCEDDFGNSPRMAREMAGLIPGARVAIVPRLRHMGLFEEPQPFTGLMLDFFSDTMLADARKASS